MYKNIYSRLRIFCTYYLLVFFITHVFLIDLHFLRWLTNKNKNFFFYIFTYVVVKQTHYAYGKRIKNVLMYFGLWNFDSGETAKRGRRLG